MVVPLAPEAAWWQLARQFVSVGSWDSGSRHLEASVLGRWKGVAAARPSLLLYFPRAGAKLVPLSLSRELGSIISVQGDPGGVAAAASWINLDTPLPSGSMLYAQRRLTAEQLVEAGQFGTSGTLYVTTDVWDGRDEPRCAHLRRVRVCLRLVDRAPR